MLYVDMFILNTIDVNECNTDNGGCHHNCTNAEGSFTCSCKDGFHLRDDDLNCDGIWCDLHTCIYDNTLLT